MRVKRADEALRQEDSYNEMNTIARKMSKFAQQVSKVQQADSDKPTKIVNWGTIEDSMQTRY